MALARGWKVLLVTSAGVYLVSLDVTIVNIAFRDLNADFSGASPNRLQGSGSPPLPGTDTGSPPPHRM